MRYVLTALVWTCCASTLPAADVWPSLPERDAAVEIPAQEWPLKPGPRTVRILIHYPGGALSAVGPKTGVMLTLHNWGGTDCVGTADPRRLAKDLDVVAICVNYLQSGKVSIDGPEPYDYGYLQGLDALRALWFVRHALQERKQPFAAGRLYATGGSGGGNVSLMANKLAPRTFAAVIDMCGMANLSDDVAFNRPGGSELDARWVRQPGHPFHLSRDDQEIRYVGFPDHLTTMKSLGTSARVFVIHGAEDDVCPTASAREMVAHMQSAGLDVVPRFVTRADVDGKVFTSTGHSLGNRTEIVLQVAGKVLKPDSPDLLQRNEPTDFDRRDEVRYQTASGTFVISYADGYPVGRFAAKPAALPHYADWQDLKYWLDDKGERHVVKSPADWEHRRRHILAGMELVMGKLPGALSRVPLDVKVLDETRVGKLVRRKVSYQSDQDDRVNAWIFLPADAPKDKLPAVLCVHQTVRSGKDEPAGLGQNKNLQYALDLAERGYVTIAPDYPGFGEHTYDFSPAHGYESGTMKAIWDNIRAIDLLQTLDVVDSERIGCVGHSLGGHSAMFTAAFDTRIKATVSSCGYTRFHKDDVPSWTGKTYMPKIATVFQNSADKLPFDFPEIIGSFAPRAFFSSAAVGDTDFDVQGVRESIESAKPIFALYGKPENLEAYYPAGPHAFPPDAREKAWAFFDRQLKKR